MTSSHSAPRARSRKSPGGGPMGIGTAPPPPPAATIAPGTAAPTGATTTGAPTTGPPAPGKPPPAATGGTTAAPHPNILTLGNVRVVNHRRRSAQQRHKKKANVTKQLQAHAIALKNQPEFSYKTPDPVTSPAKRYWTKLKAPDATCRPTCRVCRAKLAPRTCTSA